MEHHWCQNDALAPMVLGYLDLEGLLALEATSAFRVDPFSHMRRAFQHLGRRTGAVCYWSCTAVGEGSNPKLELLDWLRHRSSFARQQTSTTQTDVSALHFSTDDR